jgi:hypothetical protein
MICITGILMVTRFIQGKTQEKTKKIVKWLTEQGILSTEYLSMSEWRGNEREKGDTMTVFYFFTGCGIGCLIAIVMMVIGG